MGRPRPQARLPGRARPGCGRGGRGPPAPGPGRPPRRRDEPRGMRASTGTMPSSPTPSAPSTPPSRHAVPACPSPTSAPPVSSTGPSPSPTTSSTSRTRSTATGPRTREGALRPEPAPGALQSTRPLRWSAAGRARTTSLWPGSSASSRPGPPRSTPSATSWAPRPTPPTSPAASSASSPPEATAVPPHRSWWRQSLRRGGARLDLLDIADVELVEVGSDFFAEEFFARRPHRRSWRTSCSGLQGMNGMRPWEDALADYVERFVPRIRARQRVA